MKPAKKATKAETKKETLEITMSVVRGDVDDIVKRMEILHGRLYDALRLWFWTYVIIGTLVAMITGFACDFYNHRPAKTPSTKALYSNAASTAVNRY